MRVQVFRSPLPWPPITRIAGHSSEASVRKCLFAFDPFADSLQQPLCPRSHAQKLWEQEVVDVLVSVYGTRSVLMVVWATLEVRVWVVVERVVAV